MDTQFYLNISDTFLCEISPRHYTQKHNGSIRISIGKNWKTKNASTQQNPGGSKSQIWIFATKNSGTSWSAPISLSGPGGRGTATSFPFTVSSSDGTNVFVGWSQQVNSGYWVFRVAYSGDDGSTWTIPPGINVSGNPSGTQAGNNNDVANGAIAASGARCYAVWLYVSGRTNQIYFTHS